MVAYVGPSRDAWRFRNVTQGFDFTPRLESIEITDAKPEDVATFSCEVVDADSTLVFQPEDKVWVTFGTRRIFAGHIKRRGRGQDSEVGPRVFHLECQDYTAKLDDSIITRKKDRPRERIRKRLRWIHDNLNYSMVLDVSGVPSDEYVEASNYHGMSTLEAFEHVASETSLFMDVDFDQDADGSPTLSFYRTITAVAVIDLDNSAPDFADTFPYREFIDWDDSSDLATMVYVIPEKEQESRWVVDETQRGIYGWQQSSITDTSIKGKNGAIRIGGKFLDEFDQPLTEGECVVHEPGLRSGEKVHIVNALWGLDYDRYITSVTTTGVDPHDDAGEAYLLTHITFSDRRKVHRRPSRPVRGDIAVPTDPVDVITDWPTVEPPTQSDGAAIAIEWAGKMSHGRAYYDVTIYYEPTWKAYGTVPTDPWLRSHLSGYTAGKPAWSACSGTLNMHFAGFSEDEHWMRVLMPDPIPTDAAGIEFDFPILPDTGGVQGPSYASIAPVEIVALGHQPTTMGQGVVIGTGYAGQTVTALIPASVLPGAGEYAYVGYRTGWHNDGVANPYAHVCGFHWPFMSTQYLLTAGGSPWGGYSGRVKVRKPTADGTWKVWDSTPAGLGTSEQGNTIIDAGQTGDADAWSIGPDGFSLIASTPSSKGIYMVGGNEDADEPLAPWSDGHYASKVTFTVTNDGVTTDAGTREVRITTTASGEVTQGAIHMGDGNHVEGISVNGGAAEDFQAGALTNDVRMVAMFDTRNGTEVRGKIWVEGQGEPTEWVVFSDIADVETEQERLELWLRAGNAGTLQGVTVHKVEAIDGAAPGQAVIGQFIGYASGYEKTFYVPDRYKEGSLRVFVNGKLTPTSSEDGQATTFQLDWWPTAGSAIVLDYIAAGGEDT